MKSKTEDSTLNDLFKVSIESVKTSHEVITNLRELAEKITDPELKSNIEALASRLLESSAAELESLEKVVKNKQHG